MDRKEISWRDSEYLDKVRLEDKAMRCQSVFRNLNAKSQASVLERKPSIGPCFKPGMLYGGPSGITICIPKKSVRKMKEEFNPIQSVIDFNVSKKVPKSMSVIINNKAVKKIDSDQQQIKFLGGLKLKLENMSCKIRNLLM